MSNSKYKGQPIVNGRFSKKEMTQEEKQKEIDERREKNRRELGFVKEMIEDPEYMMEAHTEVMRKHGQIDKDASTAFTKDFWSFMNFGIPRDYAYPLSNNIKAHVEDMLGNRYPKNATRKDGKSLVLDYANFYTPMDDMYGSAEGKDLWYEYGRIPISHLNALCSKRIGVGFAVCNRPARDVFDNGFDIVKEGDPDGDPLKYDKDDVVKKVRDLNKRTEFEGRLVEIFDYANRCGLSHLVVDEYDKEPHSGKKWEEGLRWAMVAPKTDPVKFSTFTAEYMCPLNAYDTNYLDYNKREWDYRGGMFGKEIHHSRNYPLELYREEIGLRGLALPEPCFVSFMCYLNMSYYMLKGLSKLGTYTLAIQSQNLIPTIPEIEGYMESGQLMKANDIVVLGAGANLEVKNAAAAIGAGVNDIMEFYKEDICASTCFPKNQLFGRAQGGGLDGAGAVVSKEDYLGSNLSPLMSVASRKVPIILRDLCNIDLGERMIRFNIDAHKTEEQRLTEEILRINVKMENLGLEQAETAQPLFKNQMKLQLKMAKIQNEMFDKDPEGFMMQSEKDEENTSEEVSEKVKQDFVDYKKKLQWQFDMLLGEYNRNNQLINLLNRNTQRIYGRYVRDNKALRIQREDEKRYGNRD